jgi:Rieske Fe-S protein
MAIPVLTRRTVVRGVLVTAIGGVAGYLTGRSTGGSGHAAPAGDAYGSPPPAAPLLSLSRLPAGGVVVLADARIVLSRGAGDDVHAFSAVCTHQGCTVEATGGAVACPCHGSRFAADSGAVRQGPAARPLPPIPVVVRNGEVYRS